MTLQERQKREIERLTLEKADIKDQIETLQQEEADMYWAIRHVSEDPETYFKNIDEQE